jgi:hypothetical protein
VSHYGVVYPEFWTGPTGRLIAKAGRDAQVLALYLVSCRSATMIGFFYCPFDVMRQETHLGARPLTRALEVLRDPCGFAAFDPAAEVVWVFEMAKFRLGTAKKPLDRDDNRVAHCQRLYAELVENLYLGPFFDRYKSELKLRDRREWSGHHKISPLPRGLEAPSKPVNRSVRTGTEDQDQRSGTGNRKSTARARGIPARRDDVLKALVLREVQAGLAEGETDHADLTERVKLAAARAHLAYDGLSAALLRHTITAATKRLARRAV